MCVGYCFVSDDKYWYLMENYMICMQYIIPYIPIVFSEELGNLYIFYFVFLLYMTDNFVNVNGS